MHVIKQALVVGCLSAAGGVFAHYFEVSFFLGAWACLVGYAMADA